MSSPVVLHSLIASPNAKSLVHANVAMFCVTALVWVFLFIKRVPFMQSHPKLMKVTSRAALYAAMADRPDVTAPSDNLLNLFEVPVLFYAVSALLLISGNVSTETVVLAQAYAFLRACHSFVHCTGQSVMVRFTLYAISCAVLAKMWFNLAMSL